MFTLGFVSTAQPVPTAPDVVGGTGMIAVMDAAALDIALRPRADQAAARLLLNQGAGCLHSVSYPMRRVGAASGEAGIDEAESRTGVDRLLATGFPAERSADEAWEQFAAYRRRYAPGVYQRRSRKGRDARCSDSRRLHGTYGVADSRPRLGRWRGAFGPDRCLTFQ